MALPIFHLYLVPFHCYSIRLSLLYHSLIIWQHKSIHLTMEEDNFGKWKEPLYEDAESSSEHSVLMGREEQYTKMTPRRRWLWWSSLRLLFEVLMGLFIIVTVSLLGSHQIIWYPPKSTILRYGPSRKCSAPLLSISP